MKPKKPQTPAKILPIEYYHGLPQESYLDFRKKVIDECGITMDTFYRWLRNPEKIKKSNRVMINRIAETELHYERA